MRRPFVVMVLCCILSSWYTLSGCGSDPLDFVFIDEQGAPIRGSIQEVTITLEQSAATWNIKVAPGAENTSAPSEGRFTHNETLNCTEAQVAKSGSTRVPYLSIVAKVKDGETAKELLGAIPVSLACQRAQARVRMLTVGALHTPPLAQLAEGSVTNTTAQTLLARIGHQVSRLPDGRYLISGGVKNFGFSFEQGLPLPPAKDFVGRMAVYDPYTHKLEDAGAMLPRAFHSVVVIGDEVLVIGGIAPVPPGQSTAPMALASRYRIVTEPSWKLELVETEASTPGGKVRSAFQHTIVAPIEEGQGALVVPTGGISCYLTCDKTPKNKDNLQLLYHTTTYIPDLGATSGRIGRVVVVGGVLFNPQTRRYDPSTAGLVIEIRKNASGNGYTLVSFSFSLPSERDFRAGHTAVLLGSGKKAKIALIGGYILKQGATQPIEPGFLHEDVRLLSVPSRDSDKPQSVAMTLVGDETRDFRRIFMTTSLLPTTTTPTALVYGGLDCRQQGCRGGLSQVEERKSALVLSFDLAKEQVEVTRRFSRPDAAIFHQAVPLDSGQILLLGGSTTSLIKQRITQSNVVGVDFSAKALLELYTPTP